MLKWRKHEIKQRVSIFKSGVEVVEYRNELDMEQMMPLVEKDLSEPYSIQTYRFFINNWPGLTFLVLSLSEEERVLWERWTGCFYDVEGESEGEDGSKKLKLKRKDN